MSKTYKEWLKYYENATKEQVIEEVTQDNLEIERLNNIIKEVRELLTKDYEYTINNFVTDNPRYLLDKFEEILDKVGDEISK